MNSKKIVIKIGSSSLMHESTGKLNLGKIEKLVRILVDIKNSGKECVLVSSGAIAVGRNTIGLKKRPEHLPLKQACAAIGQAKLMSVYQRLFAEYSTSAAQVLLTKANLSNPETRKNAENTLNELLWLDTVPIINENDSVSTDEIAFVQTFGDNDRLSALVAELIGADLLILLSDIDGMYTDDPKSHPDAKLIAEVTSIEKVTDMAKGTSAAGVGTGGMEAKVAAAQIATMAGANMVITNGNDVENITRVLNGEEVGTLFTRGAQ